MFQGLQCACLSADRFSILAQKVCDDVAWICPQCARKVMETETVHSTQGTRNLRASQSHNNT